LPSKCVLPNPKKMPAAAFCRRYQTSNLSNQSPVRYTVVAISIRSSKFRTGLFNDDRLAGQFKLRTDFADFWNRRRLGQLKFRMELIGQAARLPGAVNSLARGAGRAGGGTAGPAGPPGSLIAVCVASVSQENPGNPGQENRLPFGFFSTRGSSKRDAVSALNSQGEEPPAETQPPTCPNFFGVHFNEGTVFFDRAERPNATR
jgi:hypothetical protein